MATGVGRGGEVGHKLVPKPSELWGAMEKVDHQGPLGAVWWHWGRSGGIGGVLLQGGTPVDELCLGN